MSFDHGMITSLKQLDSALACSRKAGVCRASLARLGIVGRGRRRGRGARTGRRARAAAATNGVAASSAGRRALDPGQRLAGERAQRRERARSGSAKAGAAASSVPGSSEIASASAASSAANEPAKIRKLVTRSCKRDLVAAERRDDPVEVPDHVREVVRVLAEERLVDLRAVLEGARRGAVELAGIPRRRRGRSAPSRTPRGRSGAPRGRRTGAWSGPGRAARCSRSGRCRTRSPRRPRPPPGVPALSSTNRLPSRNSRGRSLKVASVLIGRPSSLISIVTIEAPVAASASALSPPVTRAAAAARRCSTSVTLPTLTPAIRTGESARRFGAEVNTALTSYGAPPRKLLGERRARSRRGRATMISSRSPSSGVRVLRARLHRLPGLRRPRRDACVARSRVPSCL